MANDTAEERLAGYAKDYKTQATDPAVSIQKAQDIRSAVFSDAPEIEGSRNAINDKIKELYDYDQKAQDQYHTPGGKMYVEDPNAAWAAEQSRRGSISGEVGDLFTRLGRYQDLYGNVAEQGLKAWEKSLASIKDMMEFEKGEIKTKRDDMESDRQYELQLKQLAQSDADRGKDTLDEELSWFNKIIGNSQTGANFEDQLNQLIPQLEKKGLNVQNIWDMYDAGFQGQEGMGPGVAARRGVDLPGAKEDSGVQTTQSLREEIVNAKAEGVSAALIFSTLISQFPQLEPEDISNEMRAMGLESGYFQF